MSGWGCVHEIHEQCSRLGYRPCDPGMKGCILAGRFRFSNPDKNRRRDPNSDESTVPVPPQPPPPSPED